MAKRLNVNQSGMLFSFSYVKKDIMQNLYSSKIKKTIKKSLRLIEGMVPFTQKPSKNQYANNEIVDKENNNPETDDRETADALFSFFTADIIKEQVIFTR